MRQERQPGGPADCNEVVVENTLLCRHEVEVEAVCEWPDTPVSHERWQHLALHAIRLSVSHKDVAVALMLSCYQSKADENTSEDSVTRSQV